MHRNAKKIACGANNILYTSILSNKDFRKVKNKYIYNSAAGEFLGGISLITIKGVWPDVEITVRYPPIEIRSKNRYLTDSAYRSGTMSENAGRNLSDDFFRKFLLTFSIRIFFAKYKYQKILSVKLKKIMENPDPGR